MTDEERKAAAQKRVELRRRRREELHERRRQALARPEAAAEWVLREVELDAHFAALDEQDEAIAQADRRAIEQELRDGDGPAAPSRP